MFARLINLSKSNSFFLFGARATGKSTLLNHIFKPEEAYFIDLLKEEEFLRYANSTGMLEQTIASLPPEISWVIIDEVQKLPKLLDEVHRQIFQGGHNFALTGSSARKLKHGKANLLAGRAFTYSLFPLTHIEIGKTFNLDKALSWGTLPEIFRFQDLADKARFLQSYASTYVKEEVAAEQLVRGVLPFQRFLPVAAQSNGELINYSKIARDVGVDDLTVKNYFNILEDTLLGFLLESYHSSLRKRQRSAPKFYFFDLGLVRYLNGLISTPLTPGTYGYGNAFEHFIILEIMRLAAYAEKNWRFSYLRTSGDAEIDLIIEAPNQPTYLIEIKSSALVDDKTIRTLENFAAGFHSSRAIVLSKEISARKVGKVEIFPWAEGLKELGLA